MVSEYDSVESEVNSITGGGATFEGVQALARHVLEDVFQEGGPGDPLARDPQVRERGKLWCCAVWKFLLREQWFLPAQNLLRKLWDLHAEHQRSSKRRVHRALLSQLLTQTAHKVGNSAEAFRWSLLTGADDILNKCSEAGGYSKHWLYAKFGLSDMERKALDAVAKGCRDEAKKNGWDSPAGFAEEVLRRFVQNDKNGRDVLQRLSGTEEFHLTRPYLRVLLDHVDKACGNKAKGKRLEDIAFYLFSLLPACVPRRNVLDLARASEYDLVVSNMSPTSSLICDVFGRDFLVECKNWNRNVGVEQVGYFLFRMGLTHCRFGVILSRKGITDKPGADAYAGALIRRAFHEHGAVCIAISLSDLKKLAAGKVAGVAGLLIEQLNDFRFGRANG